MPKQEIPLKEIATAPEEISNDSSDELSDDRRREIYSFVNMPSPYRNVSQTLSQIADKVN